MTDVADTYVSDGPQLADLPAEASVLGALLLSPRAVADIAGVLSAGDFYSPKHQSIYAACTQLYERGEPVDPISVSAVLGIELARVGGAPYLHSLTATVPSITSAGYYARLVAEKAAARRLAAAGTRITQLANGPGDVAEMLIEAERALTAAATGQGPDTAAALAELVDPVIDDLDHDRPVGGLPTGYLDLDMVLNPLEPGQLIVIGARPSIGKSTVALDIARNAALRLSERTLFVSLEMSSQELVRRLIAAEAKVELTHIQRHELSDDDWTRVARTRDRLYAAPLVIDAPAGHTLGSLRAVVRRHKPALLILDYLQLVTPPKAKDRRESVDELTRGLKLLARDEQVPVVVLSQLNRGAESRGDRRPAMSDLRESGSIEQDADVVILLHRPDFYDPDDHPGDVEIIIAKQRGGPTATVRLLAQLHYSRFADLAGYLS